MDENVVLGLHNRRLHVFQSGGQSRGGKSGDAERAGQGRLDGVAGKLRVTLSCARFKFFGLGVANERSP